MYCFLMLYNYQPNFSRILLMLQWVARSENNQENPQKLSQRVPQTNICNFLCSCSSTFIWQASTTHGLAIEKDDLDVSKELLKPL